MSLIKRFEDVFSQPRGLQNVWITRLGIDTYVRVSKRCVGSEGLEPVFDVSTLTAKKPGSGKLGELFTEIETAARHGGMAGVYVENVFNERLRGWLERRGYTVIRHDWGDVPSYWRRLSE